MTTRVDGCDTVLYAYPCKRTVLRSYPAFLLKQGPRLAVHPVQTLPLRASTPTRAGMEAHNIRAASQTTRTWQRDQIKDRCRGCHPRERLSVHDFSLRKATLRPMRPVADITPGGSHKQECSRQVFPSGASTSELFPPSTAPSVQVSYPAVPPSGEDEWRPPDCRALSGVGQSHERDPPPSSLA